MSENSKNSRCGSCKSLDVISLGKQNNKPALVKGGFVVYL